MKALPSPAQVEDMTEVPAELSRVSDEDDRGEIRCAESEGRDPRTHLAAAQDEAGYRAGFLAGSDTDADHHCEEDDQHDDTDDFCAHFLLLPFE